MKYLFSKGRVALYAILKAMGVGPGDEVILPGYTCVVVANAVLYLGARPVFVDIDPATCNLDPAQTECAITRASKVVVVQHTLGVPADMGRFVALCKSRGLSLIEDCCHALGSRHDGREVGTFGDAAFFSSQWSKPVTTGLGGWAIVHNPTLAAQMDRLYPSFPAPPTFATWQLRAQYLAYAKLFAPVHFWPARAAYRRLAAAGLLVGSSASEELAGRQPAAYATRMSDWQAALLADNLARRETVVRHRRHAAATCERLLRQCGMPTVQLPAGSDPVYLRYPVRVADKAAALVAARRRHVQLGDWFVSPLHPNLVHWHKSGYREGSCPVAEDTARHMVNLPTDPQVTDADLAVAVALLRDHV